MTLAEHFYCIMKSFQYNCLCLWRFKKKKLQASSIHGLALSCLGGNSSNKSQQMVYKEGRLKTESVLVLCSGLGRSLYFSQITLIQPIHRTLPAGWISLVNMIHHLRADTDQMIN